MLHLEFNSDSENEGIARIVTAAYIMKFDPDMEEMDDIKTAVSEAVTNCIVHAYHDPDGKISMDLSDQNGILRIEIKDQGIGIPDVKKAMEPMFTTKPEEERTGMGFSFMEAFMDQVEVISKQGEGTTVIMTKKIGYESEDLFQIGSIGLMKAVDKFDLSYDVKFSTYAVPMITGEIRRFLRDDGMIKVSRSLKENVYKIMKAREKFCQQYQREATIEEISEITKITREEIVTSLEASNEVESIHQSAYQKDGSEISLLDKLSKGENESEKVVDHVLLKEAMKHLEQKEQQMIYYRYFEGKTQQEIAKIFHISQVQVSRIEKRILKKLRRQMIGNI